MAVMRQVLSLLVISIFLSEYSCYSDIETKLLQDLLNNYTALGRPVVSNNDAVHVTFDLKLHKIEKLLTKEQHLITHTFVVMRWKEPRMVWDPSKHNGTQILNFASSSLWVPDIVLYNTADIGNNGPADFYKSPVHVYSNGTAVWFATVAWQSSCAVDITWFPVDQQVLFPRSEGVPPAGALYPKSHRRQMQKCDLIFGSWSFSKSRLKLSFHSLPTQYAHLQSNHHVTNGEWTVSSTKARANEHQYDCCHEPISQVIYTITMSRRPLYFFLYLIFPMIAIVLLSLLIFKIPADTGERIGFAVTILLTMGVYLIVISQDLPRKADKAPLVGVLYVTLFYVMVLGCVSGVVTAGIAFKITPPPKWLSLLVIRLTKKSSKRIGALKASLRKLPIPEENSADEELRTISEVSEIEMKATNDKDNIISEREADKVQTRPPTLRQRSTFQKRSMLQEFTQIQIDNQKQWQEIAYCLDRIFFWLYLGMVVVASCAVLLGLAIESGILSKN